MLKLVVKKFVVFNEVFAICKTNDGKYVSINYKYVDPVTGQLTRVLNGLQTHAEDTLEKTMAGTYSSERIKRELDTDLLKNYDINELNKMNEIILDSFKKFGIM